jgi:RHS repeat-associated protein
MVSNDSTGISPLAPTLFLVVISCLLLPAGALITDAMADTPPTSDSSPPTPVGNISDSVAGTAAEFRVDESGAATYKVPIYAAPGTAGVAPKISLKYSSQGAVGPLGRGWSLEGVSTIGRCRASREAGDFISGGVPQDGSPGPINFSATDRYCLDGQRLLPVANTPACPAGNGAVAQFRTEIEAFQRVCAYTPSGGNGPAYFTVERKDGSLSWYGDRNSHAAGNRPDGYVNSNLAGHTAKAIAWAQTRFQDSTGNYIEYLYSENPGGGDWLGEHLLTEIRYTGKVKLPGQQGTDLAPYASLIFGYQTVANGAIAAWRRGYSSSGVFSQTYLLTSVTAMDGDTQLRHYELNYAHSPSISGGPVMTSLRECRDSGKTLCLPATTFEWSSAKFDFETAEDTAGMQAGSISKFEGMKFGDVDGDGRQDMVWIKDGTSDDSCSTENINVAFSRVDPSGKPFFHLIGSICAPAELVGDPGDSSWFLFDYDGDGKEDLFISGTSRWLGYRSKGTTGTHPFAATQDLLAELSPVIPRAASIDLNPQLSDLNGDGLFDLLYFSNGTFKARIMERGGTWGFRWGGERAVQLTGMTAAAVGAYQKNNYQQLNDFNGDARSDVLVKFAASSGCGGGGPGGPGGPGDPRPPTHPQSTNCTNVYAMAVDAITQSAISLQPYANLGDLSGDKYSFADINGDGLTDFVRHGEDISRPAYWMNIGTGFGNGALLGNDAVYHIRHLQVADVNGDGRADLAVPSQDGRHMVSYRGASTEGFSTAVPMPKALTACSDWECLNERTLLFGDYDGDGVTEFVRIKWDDGSTPIFFSRAAQRFKARNVIVAITNGLGARTEIDYAPLTDAGVYRKDAGSRNAMNVGRGSPVQDVLIPLYVVSKASSSSPNADTGINGMATLFYRYAGARIQAGGRGFLGFHEIVTVDTNQSGGYVATSTTYRQDYPFIGMPLQTRKHALVGQTYEQDQCANTYTDYCFQQLGVAFPTLGGKVFSDSAHGWEASPVFAAGTQSPVQVRTRETDETVSDPNTGAATSGVLTDFGYDGYGNVTSSRVDTITFSAGTGTLTETVWTDNAYAQDSPAQWRLGRLTSAVVTHQRPGKDDVVRTTSFSYSMSGPATGLLIAERTQPGGDATQDLRKFYSHDAFGNRVRAITCSRDIPDDCELSGFAFHQPSNVGVHRYTRTVYDSRGRYPIATYEPFRNGDSYIEKATLTVAARDAFGGVTRALDVNGVYTVAGAGELGRPAYSWVQTVPGSAPGEVGGGTESTMTYRWCGSATSHASCPSGAKFRVRKLTMGAPTEWTYFDVLGRPVMKAAETFNIGVSGKDISAVCTTYTVAGKVKQVSNPFFLPGTGGSNGPEGIDNACAARLGTTTTYDLLGRATSVEWPDPGDGGKAATTSAYNNLTTGTRDARNNLTNTYRNGKGEVTHVVDAAGLGLYYSYDAAGNLTEVRRNGGRGEIVNSYRYDALGRKVFQSDPDAGETTYNYNALGEVLAQYSADTHVTWVFDARGRPRRKNVYREHDRLENDVLESTTDWTYDTAARGAGQIASESMMGYYGSDAGPAIDFNRSYTYDQIGRPIAVTTSIDGENFHTTTQYDDLGRPYKAKDATGQWSKVEYQARGAVAVCFSSEADIVFDCGANAWQRTLETDAWGNVRRETRSAAGDLTLRREVNALTGRVTQLCADKPGGADCQLVNEQYAWDKAGNLHTHQKEGRYLEGFDYDSLNRLTTATIEIRNGVTDGTVSQVLVYDKLGNVCRKQTFGATQDYTYTGRAGCGTGGLPGSGGSGIAGPTQVYQAGGVAHYYDDRGNLTLSDAAGTSSDRAVSYGAGGQAWQVTQGGKRTRFWYGPDGARYKAEHQDLGETVYYIGNVEVVRQGAATSYRRNIGGFLVQRVVNGVNTNHYLWHDHLGSLVRMTDGLGNVSTTSDFAAYGERRNAANPHQAGVEPSAEVTRRGFTGHEHFGRLSLIHMNGRIYDPGLGRFMQADPVIQAPGNAQSWNAYTYVFNNPLRYTDPTGMLGQEERQWLGAVIMIAAVITQQYWGLEGAAAAAFYAGAGFVSGAVATQSWRGGLLGAMTAVTTAGIASAGGTGLEAWAVQTFTGGVMGSLQGGDFGHAFLSAGLSAAFMPQVGQIGDPVARTVTGAIVGGTISKLTGGKFANGAVTGAIQAAMTGRQNGDDESSRTDSRSAWNRVKGWFSRTRNSLAGAEELNDPDVVDGFNGAWQDSKHWDYYSRHEEGGFIGIERDLTFGTRRWPSGHRTGIKPPRLDATNIFEGLLVTGEFHVHPNPRLISPDLQP